MKFITSDLHFNHEAILKFCKETRPFQTTQEMNEAGIVTGKQIGRAHV